MNVGDRSPDPRLGGHQVHRIVLDEQQIAERVRELGLEITEAYRGRNLLILGLLKGSFIFVSDLVRHIHLPLQVDFLSASSYGSSRKSKGKVELLYDPETNLTGRDILLVEDIVDSGQTLDTLYAILESRGPASLESCTLLNKHIASGMIHSPRFTGFDAPDEFLVGYGLDHAEDFRHLPYIASLV